MRCTSPLGSIMRARVRGEPGSAGFPARPAPGAVALRARSRLRPRDPQFLPDMPRHRRGLPGRGHADRPDGCPVKSGAQSAEIAAPLDCGPGKSPSTRKGGAGAPHRHRLAPSAGCTGRVRRTADDRRWVDPIGGAADINHSPRTGLSLQLAALNRRKRSVAEDLRTSEGRDSSWHW